MRLIVFFILAFCSSFHSLASKNLFTQHITEDFNTQLSISDSLLILNDEAQTLTIEEVMSLLPSSSLYIKELEYTEKARHIWAGLAIKNTSDRIINEYFRFCKSIQSVEVYTVENDLIQDIQQAGSKLKPSEKSMPLSSNQIPFGLDPGKEKMFYFKISFAPESETYHFNHLYIGPGENKIANIISAYMWQPFYIGIMILFSLISFFMYFIFREKIFVFLAMIMFFFALYFLTLKGIAYVFLDIPNPDNPYFVIRIYVSCILISGFLFTSEYIQLKTSKRKYFLFYKYYTLFATTFPHVYMLLVKDVVSISKLSNILTALWLLFTIVPVILMAKRKDKSARILLISFASMVISAIFYTVNLIYNVSYSGFAKDSFQIGVIIFSCILFYGLFDKIDTIRKEKQHMKDLDELKSRFFSNISHEFRTPLSLIMGPIKELHESTEKSGDQKLLALAYKNAQRLLALINQLLDLSKLEAGKMDLQAKEHDFTTLMKEIIGSFESLAHQKNILIKLEHPQQFIPLFVDRDKIEKVFYNLISNAIKFAKPAHEGRIIVAIKDQKNDVEITVLDKGIGIPKHRLNYIFDRFFQVEDTAQHAQEGTGIGLALVKELVELHAGTITVESKENIETCFIIHLPKGKLHLKEGQLLNTDQASNAPDIIADTASTHISDEQLTTAIESSSELPSVLLVEDNPDLRNYIKQQLTGTYAVLEADNGQKGIEQTIAHQPDLVISDVMMPEKNGYELAHFLKNDSRTSHIPIILLTAKAGEEEKITGLETGADDYLVKPFNSKELNIRVANLIQLRKDLRKRFSEHGPVAANKTKGMNSLDKAFLDKVVQCVDLNFQDNQFSVDTLASEVAMSKVHLNRKLKSLTDFSTNKFIQSYRLQKALKMLQEKEGNVSEIAHKTGFNSTAYFVKCFREKYDTTPGALLEN